MNEQNEITNETYISDYSSAFPLERLIFPDFKSVRMALNTNTNDEIYCTTNDGHFIIFNTTTDQEVFNTQIDLPYTHLTQSKIVYNKWNNHVYWIYYGIDATTSPLVFGTSVSGFLDFNATNREFVDTQSADNSHGYIDIFIHPARERYYLSVICTGSSKSEIRICNFSNICLNTYYVDLGYDNMYFIHHFDYLPPLDSGLNSWIYCLPDSRIPVTFTVDAILLDGDNDFADMEIQNLNGYSVTSGFYDQSLKRYYLGYDVMTGYINGVYVYDFSQDIFNPDLLLQDKRNAKPVNFCFNPEDHLVYCVFYDAIHSYDMDLDIELNDDYLYEPLLNAYYDDSRNEVVAINYTGGKIEKFDPITLNEDTDPLIIGSFVPKGVYCSGADKVLLYNQLNNYHSFLCLYDESTGSMNYYNTPNNGSINSMAYDPDHDVAYIAQSSRIQIFDCYNNTFPYDPLLISNCIKIFYGENQKLYVLRKVFDSPNIYKMMIFDTQDFPTIDLIDELTVCQSTGILNDANFYYNDHLNDPEVYCSIFDMEESYGYFAAIDATYDVLITNPSIQIARPSKMEYNSIDTLIYFKCSDYSVGVLDRSDWQLNTVNTGAIFYDIAYSEHTNTLYLTCNDGKIRFIKGKNLLQTDLYITDLPVTLLYDNVNNRMFIHAYTVQTIDDNPF